MTVSSLTALVDGPTTVDIGTGVDHARLLAWESVLAQLGDVGLLERGDAADDLAHAAPSAIGMWLRVRRTVPLRELQNRLDTACCTVLGTGLPRRADRRRTDHCRGPDRGRVERR